MLCPSYYKWIYSWYWSGGDAMPQLLQMDIQLVLVRRSYAPAITNGYTAGIGPEVMRFTRSNANTIHLLDTTTYCCSIFPNCNAFKHSFFYRTMILWNALPTNLRQLDKISSFKRELTKFLWTASNIWPD